MAQILGTSVDYLTGESNDDGANTALVYKEIVKAQKKK